MLSRTILVIIVIVGCLTSRTSGVENGVQCPSCTNIKVNADLGWALSWLNGLVEGIASSFHDAGCESFNTDSITNKKTCPVQSGATPMCSFYRGTVKMETNYLFSTAEVTFTVYIHSCYQATEPLDNCCYDSASIHDSEKEIRDIVSSVSSVTEFFGSGIKYAGNICLRPSNMTYNDCSAASSIVEGIYLLGVAQLVVVVVQLSFH